MSATARKPLTSAMAATKNMTMANSPRIIGSLGHSRSRPTLGNHANSVCALVSTGTGIPDKQNVFTNDILQRGHRG